MNPAPTPEEIGQHAAAQEHQVPDGVIDLSTFDAIVCLKSDGQTLDVQIISPKGEMDLDNPAGYMAAWLATNWQTLYKMALVEFTARQEAKDPSKVSDAKIKEPTLKLVSADGLNILQSNA